MAEILGLGMTHYPPLAGTDENMADLLRWTLEDPDIPSEVKAPSTWPKGMQEEWEDPESAAQDHRKQLVSNFRTLRRTLDEFDPDVVVVWGDDQYENFRETVIPAFAVLAYDAQEAYPWADDEHPNVWGEPPDTAFAVQARRDVAKELASGLLRREIDVAYAYEPLNQNLLPHAFLNTLLFLDYDRQGFDYPLLPFSVNCYGSRVISYRGTISRFAARGRPLDPPSPSPSRCMQVGRAVANWAQETDLRVALVASASWSHAFLVDGNWRLRPDTDSDRTVYDLLRSADYDALAEIPLASIVDAGQQELLNWFCLFGAMEALDRKPSWSEFVSTHIFNSNKVFAIYD